MCWVSPRRDESDEQSQSYEHSTQAKVSTLPTHGAQPFQISLGLAVPTEDIARVARQIILVAIQRAWRGIELLLVYITIDATAKASITCAETGE